MNILGNLENVQKLLTEATSEQKNVALHLAASGGKFFLYFTNNIEMCLEMISLTQVSVRDFNFVLEIMKTIRVLLVLRP